MQCAQTATLHDGGLSETNVYWEQRML